MSSFAEGYEPVSAPPFAPLAARDSQPKRVRRLFLGFILAVLAVCAVGSFVWAFWPNYNTPLGDSERTLLLTRAGLPADFPVYPGARRMPQPKQGGVSYAVSAPVPDAAKWVEDALIRSGYEVFNGDVQGQDDYLSHLLVFRNARGGNGGAVIIREAGRGPRATTEVKILSANDERLAPPPLPTLPPNQGQGSGLKGVG